MCGIVGIFGDLDSTSQEIFETMLIIDQIRGNHATGVAVMHQKGVSVFKNTGIPNWVIANEKYGKIMKKEGIYGLIGHNRFGTKGKNTAKNAHPFMSGDITLVHNGTLTWQEELPDHKQFENDSENIAHSVNKIGIAATWEKIRGAAALVYWNNKEGTLNIIRNDQRPMAFRKSRDGKTLVFASEAWMMWGPCQRNHMYLDDATVNVEKNILYTFKWDGKELTQTETPLKEWVYQYTGESRRGYMDGWWADRHRNEAPWKEEGKPAGYLPLHRKPDEPAKLENLLISLRTKKMDVHQFRQKYEKCCMCGCSLFNDYEGSVIIDDRACICSDDVETAIDYGIDLPGVNTANMMH